MGVGPVVYMAADGVGMHLDGDGGGGVLRQRQLLGVTCR